MCASAWVLVSCSSSFFCTRACEFLVRNLLTSSDSILCCRMLFLSVNLRIWLSSTGMCLAHSYSLPLYQMSVHQPSHVMAHCVAARLCVCITGAVRFPVVTGCTVPAQLSCPSVLQLESCFEKPKVSCSAAAHCSALEAFLPQALWPGCLQQWPTWRSS